MDCNLLAVVDEFCAQDDPIRAVENDRLFAAFIGQFDHVVIGHRAQNAKRLPSFDSAQWPRIITAGYITKAIIAACAINVAIGQATAGLRRHTFIIWV